MRDFIAKAGPAGLVSLALAVLIPLLAMAAYHPLASDMPAWDQWSMAPVFEAHAAGRPVLPLLLAPYNGHYNWLPRFMLYGMGLLTRWSTRGETVAGFWWAGCALVLLLRMLWETSPRLLVLAAPFAAWVFSVLQFANFLNGYGMGQLMAGFLALLALYLLSAPDAGRARFAVALAAAAAAFTSHGAGLALAPAGLAVLLLLEARPNRRRIAAWLALSAGALVLGALGSTHLLMSWGRMPAFALTLLGRPFTIDMGPRPGRTAVLGGALLLALIALLGYRIAREGSACRAVLVRWGSLALLALATSGLVAVSRASSPFEWAQSTHYVTSTYPFGIALLVLAADALDGHVSRRGRWTGLAVAGLAACVVAPLVQQGVAMKRLLPVLRVWHEMAERSVRRLVVDTITDDDIRASLHPNVALVRRSVAMLRTQRLAWFAHARLARRPSGSLDAVTGQPAASEVVLKEGAPWVFEGWALPPLTELEAPVDAAVVVDGRVVVRAVPGRPRPDLQDYYGSSRFLRQGFAITVADGPSRPPGRYQVRVIAQSGRRGVLLRKLDLVVAP